MSKIVIMLQAIENCLFLFYFNPPSALQPSLLAGQSICCLSKNAVSYECKSRNRVPKNYSFNRVRRIIHSQDLIRQHGRTELMFARARYHQTKVEPRENILSQIMCFVTPLKLGCHFPLCTSKYLGPTDARNLKAPVHTCKFAANLHYNNARGKY